MLIKSLTFGALLCSISSVAAASSPRYDSAHCSLYYSLYRGAEFISVSEVKVLQGQTQLITDFRTGTVSTVSLNGDLLYVEHQYDSIEERQGFDLTLDGFGQGNAYNLSSVVENLENPPIAGASTIETTCILH
ncbi:MAG TPA: hypothetical protein VE954_08910 [Oligoflexus sp.]|uniref:hypothetical protein n=1 Tax=Oligoflexus sp. TaxID=1971216 RepID=UPI002D3FE079|nr:hypothetical protein [Oligoflexus sp.]HYX33223.1 hypothetical protein [Oligoflexus sp.]